MTMTTQNTKAKANKWRHGANNRGNKSNAASTRKQVSSFPLANFVGTQVKVLLDSTALWTGTFELGSNGTVAIMKNTFKGTTPEKSLRRVTFPARKIVSIVEAPQPPEPEPEPEPATKFRTDTAISGGDPTTSQIKERKLERWIPPDPDHEEPSLLLESSTSNNAESKPWDQFAANRELFGVPDTFDELLYTTKIDRNHPEYRERSAAAERICKEILSSPVCGNAHLAEERNMAVADGDDSGMDEEDKYAGVLRQEHTLTGDNTSRKSNESLCSTLTASTSSNNSAHGLGADGLKEEPPIETPALGERQGHQQPLESNQPLDTSTGVGLSSQETDQTISQPCPAFDFNNPTAATASTTTTKPAFTFNAKAVPFKPRNSSSAGPFYETPTAHLEMSAGPIELPPLLPHYQSHGGHVPLQFVSTGPYAYPPHLYPAQHPCHLPTHMATPPFYIAPPPFPVYGPLRYYAFAPPAHPFPWTMMPSSTGPY